VASEPALPNHFGDEQQIGSDLFLAQNVLIGRYFNVVSNKRSNKKCVNRKTLVTSILQMMAIALLRRWLWVQVWSIQFLVSARFPMGKASLHGS